MLECWRELGVEKIGEYTEVGREETRSTGGEIRALIGVGSALSTVWGKGGSTGVGTDWSGGH